MMYYARSDTHYLLYIYDMLCKELIAQPSMPMASQTSALEWVLQHSKEVSLGRYSPMLYDEEGGHGVGGWYNTLLKQPRAYNNQQFSVYKALHKWRDVRARELDESTSFVMSQKVLADVAKAMPDDYAALRPLLGGMFEASQLMDQLLGIIKEAKAAGADGPSLLDFLRRDDGVAGAKRYFDKKAAADQSSQVILPDAAEPVPDAAELRSRQSQFWGDLAASSIWDGQSSQVEAVKAPEVALPWTTFVQAAESRSKEAEAPVQATASASINGATAVGFENRVPVEDTEFTLRAGKKRKASEVDEAAAAKVEEPGRENGSDADDDEDEEEEDLEEMETVLDGQTTPNSKQKKKNKTERSRQRKAESELRKKADPESPKTKVKLLELEEQRRLKKAAKRAKRAERKALKHAELDTIAAVTAPEGVPFDYKQAVDMLSQQRQTSGVESRPAAFDPYAAKTQASMQGAKKHNYEKPGKTATFKD
jgi:exosome complex exonuclease RRP6